MQYGYPLVAWGTVEDISGAGWVTVGTATVTGGQVDPFGGTGAALVGNPDGTSNARARIFTLTADGSQWFTLVAKYSSASISEFLWFDVTASAIRATYRLTWNGGVPTATVASGSGAILTPVSLGNGWYVVLVRTDNVVAANSNRIYLRGAAPSVLGSTYYFWQSAVLLDVLDNMLAWAPVSDGSEWVRSDAGTADAWITGQDYRLRCSVCDVPDLPQSFPAIVSGWEGNHEIPCVNHGVERMIYVGQQKQTLRFVPDRSNCTQYIDSELLAPGLTDVPELQPNGQRRFVLELRNLTTRYPSIA